VYKRTIEIDSEIKALKSSIDLLKTDVADLRGNFDSRLRKIRARGIEEQQPDVKTEEFNNSGEVPFG
jgi:predicted  nucleic acid-binding Zn-ribbon protein